MKPATHKSVAEREDTYWWYKARLFILEQIFLFFWPEASNLRILNVGAGTGMLYQKFSRFGQVISLDYSFEPLEFSRQKGSKENILADAQALPCKDKSFDLVIACDVLEHLDNDRAGIEEMKRVLKPGGKCLITVPAYNFMWSRMDEIAFHQRRYTRYTILSLLTKLGLKPKKISYFNSLLFPLAFVQRFYEKIFRVQVDENNALPSLPPLLNKIFTKIFSFEAYILRRLNFPYGLSLLAVGEKSWQKDIL